MTQMCLIGHVKLVKLHLTLDSKCKLINIYINQLLPFSILSFLNPVDDGTDVINCSCWKPKTIDANQPHQSDITGLYCIYTLSHTENDSDVTERAKGYTVQDASFMRQSQNSFLNI